MGPTPEKDIEMRMLESVQKFGLKVCLKQWNSTYENLIDQAGIPSLAVSRGGSRNCLRVVLLVGEAHLPINRRYLGGSGGMPPQKIFGNMDALRCNLAHS